MSLDDRDERPDNRAPVRAELVHVEHWSAPQPGLLERFFADPPERRREPEDRAPTQAERRELARIEFRENPEMRLPCALWLDKSGSTRGEANREMNAGLKVFCETLASSSLAAKRVETGILSFGGGVSIDHDFATLDRLRMPTIQAGGDTPMAAAILQGLRMIQDRMQLYRENRISTRAPLIFLISDGAPTDPELWDAAVRAVRRGEEAGDFLFFAIGVGEEADMRKLAELSRRPPKRLRGYCFSELLEWAASLSVSVSMSRSGDVVRPGPTSGWEEFRIR